MEVLRDHRARNSPSFLPDTLSPRRGIGPNRQRDIEPEALATMLRIPIDNRCKATQPDRVCLTRPVDLSCVSTPFRDLAPVIVSHS